MQTRWSPLALRLFYFFFRPFMKRRLAGVYLHGLPETLPAQTSVILVANHVSWWDGFLLREVHRRCARGAPLFTLMQEEQLDRFPFFRLLGVVGMRPGQPASILRAARFLEARKRRDGALWLSFFPQGRIWPSWRRPLGFQRGLQVFARLLHPVVLLPVGLHLEHLNRAVPFAFVAVGAPFVWSDGAVETVEDRVRQQLALIFDLLRQHGEETPGHWPGIRG